MNKKIIFILLSSFTLSIYTMQQQQPAWSFTHAMSDNFAQTAAELTKIDKIQKELRNISSTFIKRTKIILFFSTVLGAGLLGNGLGEIVDNKSYFVPIIKIIIGTGLSYFNYLRFSEFINVIAELDSHSD